MKVRGSIGQKEVITLIDCGATHNFISSKLVQKLGLPTTVTTNYGFIMGFGESVRGEGICRGIVLEAARIDRGRGLSSIGAGSTNVVLGM